MSYFDVRIRNEISFKDILNAFKNNIKKEKLFKVQIKNLQRANNIQAIHGLPYNPELWNDNGIIQSTTNCYAYAMNLTKNPITNENFLPRASFPNHYLHPGDLLKASKLTTANLSGENVIKLCKDDAKAIGGIFIEALPGVTPPDGAWKVALVIDPKKDYHWYRQNDDGTWSHKTDSAKVTNLDASDEIITDPQKCNRDYGLVYYSEFVGYFYVKSAA